MDKSNVTNSNQVNNLAVQTSLVLKCTKCGANLKITDKFCGNCGAAFDGDNVSVSLNENAETVPIQAPQTVSITGFDRMYSLPDNELLLKIIDEELKKVGLDKKTKLIPRDAVRKKQVLRFMFALLVFVYVSMIFFHFPFLTYLIGLIILFIFYKVTKRFDLTKYLVKQIKARPSEKFTSIVMSTKESLVEDHDRWAFLIALFAAVVLPLGIFFNPRIMYEKMDNGWGVRFYTFGLTNFKTAVIPETYKNEKVVSLRGNTFSNMPFLEEVSLPNSIVEIRGQAFKNDKRLKKVNIPVNLEYLGGGAFYNCRSITSIELPDTLTYMGGEVFYKAEALESIKLSNKLTEIRGNSFEECHALESISIPDSVTRIGGHAFYNCYSLSSVIIGDKSQLKEIGSSAFRLCDSLSEITIPKDTYVNMRAFKESPTKVYRIGELKYGHLINKSNYSYDSFLYLSSGDSYEEIGQYRTNKLLKNAYIRLDHSVCYANSCAYHVSYKDDTGVFDIVLDKDKPFAYVNDNLAIEVSSAYQFDRSNTLSLNVYYN